MAFWLISFYVGQNFGPLFAEMGSVLILFRGLAYFSFFSMRLTMNQKIAGTVNTLTVPIQYTFYPPLSSPLPLLQPPLSPLLSHPQVHSKNLQKSERYRI
jgi:hypothetical protein